MTQTPQEIRETFESRAHQGYVGYGLSMTDGHYAPEPRRVTVDGLHRSIPVTSDSFRYNTDFRPTPEECEAYNETFRVPEDWRPQYLELAVRWDRGWKTYEVTGTRHAYYLLRKLAPRDGFTGARLRSWLKRSDGYVIPNVISLNDSDILGSDPHGKYRALLDRNNSHYDLERDLKDS